MRTNIGGAHGTFDSSLLEGKQRFSEEHNLGLTTSEIFDPQIEDIIRELTSGNDVELRVNWRTPQGRFDGAHWITLLGGIHVGNLWGVWYNDPDDGVDGPQFSWVENTQDGRFHIEALGGDNRAVLALSETSTAPEPNVLLLQLVGMAGIIIVHRARHQPNA